MINLECKNEKIKVELKDIIRMYLPFFEGNLDISLDFGGGVCVVKIDNSEYNYDCGGKVVYDFIKLQTFRRGKTKPNRNIEPISNKKALNSKLNLVRFNKKQYNRRLSKRLKKNLYLAMSKYFDKGLPWGSLTGIRPTKIAYSYLAAGGGINKIADMLKRKYYVSAPKSDIIQQIIQNQQGYIFRDESKVNLYVHIPFCPTKCHYCSFVSLPTFKNEKLIGEYLARLCDEIAATKQLLKAQNKEILSVYIGGGTPTILDEAQLAMLLSVIDIKNEQNQIENENAQNQIEIKNGLQNFKDIEFTLEAGRPDTITAAKLAIMKQYGVNRISINPQTFLDTTLQKIGRSHSVQSLNQAYELAKSYGFIINMDLIAGLDGESLADFRYSLDFATKLAPHNITVHTLSVKNGSKAYEKGHRHVGGVGDMLDYAYDTLAQKGYLPYYLYRQKNMADNLENVGFCLKGYQSVNNITVMEESSSVWGCGAGAISKTVCYPPKKSHQKPYQNSHNCPSVSNTQTLYKNCNQPQKSHNCLTSKNENSAEYNKNRQEKHVTPSGNLINRHAELRDVKLYLENFDERLISKLKFLAK